MSTKKEIIKLLQSVKRPGMAEFIHHLETKTDYFEAPGSTKYHGNYEGGLADHSLNVYDSLMLLHTEYKDTERGIAFPDESLIIVALLHDLCKTGYYKQDDEPASEKQVSYLRDLLSKGQFPTIPSEHMMKGYVSKVIEHIKGGAFGSVDFPEYAPTYKVEDLLPMGHGEKSVYMIQKHIDLTDDEALAIRWHLGAYDPGFNFFFPTGAPAQQANRDCALVPLLISADFLATWLVDVTK